MSSCCHICVDPSCGGKQNCNCDSCTKKDSCHRYAGIKPTIRITRKCTQSCAHCCFECSPDVNGTEMTLETAQSINQFCQSNQITRAEVMGGEFFLHTHWEPILHILCQGLKHVRLVSNGDWAGNEALAQSVIGFLKEHPQYHVGISKDRFHTNKHVDAATALLVSANIPFKIPTAEQIKDDSIVPVGRSQFEYTFYSSFGCYCSQPERRYSLLIDETGEMYKCGFGAWAYAQVHSFQKGGFAAKFKEFNTKFYNVFFSSCASCRRAENSRRKTTVG